MSYTPEEKNEIRYQAALELLRFKALNVVALDGEYITIEEVNDIMCVAGMPVIVPGEIHKKELEVM